MKRLLLLIFSGVLLTGIIVAQEIVNGTITDIDGNYSITVNNGATLIMAYNEYDDVELDVDNAAISDGGSTRIVICGNSTWEQLFECWKMRLRYGASSF